jgi:hypothetical protein
MAQMATNWSAFECLQSSSSSKFHLCENQKSKMIDFLAFFFHFHSQTPYKTSDAMKSLLSIQGGRAQFKETCLCAVEGVMTEEEYRAIADGVRATNKRNASSVASEPPSKARAVSAPAAPLPSAKKVIVRVACGEQCGDLQVPHVVLTEAGWERVKKHDKCTERFRAFAEIVSATGGYEFNAAATAIVGLCGAVAAWQPNKDFHAHMLHCFGQAVRSIDLINLSFGRLMEPRGDGDAFSFNEAVMAVAAIVQQVRGNNLVAGEMSLSNRVSRSVDFGIVCDGVRKRVGLKLPDDGCVIVQKSNLSFVGFAPEVTNTTERLLGVAFRDSLRVEVLGPANKCDVTSALIECDNVATRIEHLVRSGLGGYAALLMSRPVATRWHDPKRTSPLAAPV